MSILVTQFVFYIIKIYFLSRFLLYNCKVTRNFIFDGGPTICGAVQTGSRILHVGFHCYKIIATAVANKYTFAIDSTKNNLKRKIGEPEKQKWPTSVITGN